MPNPNQTMLISMPRADNSPWCCGNLLSRGSADSSAVNSLPLTFCISGAHVGNTTVTLPLLTVGREVFPGRKGWLKTVMHPQCFLKHPDKPLLREEVLPPASGSCRRWAVTLAKS